MFREFDWIGEERGPVLPSGFARKALEVGLVGFAVGACGRLRPAARGGYEGLLVGIVHWNRPGDWM